MSGNLELEVPLFMEHLKIYFAAEIILYLLHLSCKAKKKKATVNYLTTKDRLVRKTQQLSKKFFSSVITIYENLYYNYSSSYSYNSLLPFCNLVFNLDFFLK